MQAAMREPEATARLGRPALFSFDAPIEVQVFADEPTRAVAHAKRLLPDLRAIAGLADVVPDDLAGRPEVRVDFDRERLSRLGLAVDTAALAVQLVLGSLSLTTTTRLATASVPSAAGAGGAGCARR